MKEHEKTEVIVGIEPTGHYWMNLAYFLDTMEFHLSWSIQCTSNVQRNWMIIYQTKNDKKDALVIARLMKDGRFSYPRIIKGY